MRALAVFEDDGSKVATASVAGETLLVFARSSHEWSMVSRWARQGFFADEGGEDPVEVKPGDPRYLDMLAARAQGHGFSTELSGEDEGG